MTAATLTLRQQLVEVVRRVPGFVIGAPTRWVRLLHDSPEYLDGTAYCMSPAHRSPAEWPCRKFMDACETLHDHPTWRAPHSSPST